MRASDFIKERPKSILTIFDIDDTLFHTTAKINVVKDGKVVRSLTNQEFNNYELKDGEEYDFGEFRNAEKFRQESEPIGPMLDELKTILDHTRGKVIMLTARADFDDKETFLQTFADHGIDMNRIHVHRAGNLPGKEGPAEKKAVWVRRYLDTGKFNQVSLYDDSMTNLKVFKSLEKEYPDVKFYAHHITGNGDVNTLEERRKKKRNKIRWAAWGPGPYGLYGTNTGYSGDGGISSDGGGIGEKLNESWSPEKKERIKEFALWAIKTLDIKESPRIRLVADSGTTALGYFDTESKEIVVTYKDRHQMDIMRTLAHELVHRKQLEFRELDGSTGSEDENEANAIAGVLLRHWGKMNPEHFNEGWSEKYKKSINCNNPKGFSQRAHCAGRKKNESVEDKNVDTIAKKFKVSVDYVSKQLAKGTKVETEHTKDLEKAKKIALDHLDERPDYYEKLISAGLEENFADGKKPGRKGLAKRSGVNCKASVTQLRKVAKNSSGEKQRMAHWCANMKSGKKK